MLSSSHVSATHRAYIDATAAIWAIDRFYRLLRLFYKTRNGSHMAHAKLIPGSSTISLTVYLQTTDPDWYPGANYYLYLPVPWWRLWQDHPFTVASFRYSPPGPEKVKVALEPISKEVALAPKSEVDEKHIERALPGLDQNRVNQGSL